MADSLPRQENLIEAGDYGWHPASGEYGTVREVRDDGMVVFGIGIMREPLIARLDELEILDPRRDRTEVQRDRYRKALEEIANRPAVERNPDGDDQAAHTMQMIAREALDA